MEESEDRDGATEMKEEVSKERALPPKSTQFQVFIITAATPLLKSSN